jgi:hypothetical protein
MSPNGLASKLAISVTFKSPCYELGYIIGHSGYEPRVLLLLSDTVDVVRDRRSQLVEATQVRFDMIDNLCIGEALLT